MHNKPDHSHEHLYFLRGPSTDVPHSNLSTILFSTSTVLDCTEIDRVKKRKKREKERVRETWCEWEQECERERKRVSERGTRKSKTQLQLPLSASNAKHATCNRNFFVAMYLPTNEWFINYYFSFCLHFILILFREQQLLTTTLWW